VVACVSGRISRANRADSGLGGITIWLTGNNGYRYYYATSTASPPYQFGNLGDAGDLLGWWLHRQRRQHQHLHFAMYVPGGGVANPFATLRAND